MKIVCTKPQINLNASIFMAPQLKAYICCGMFRIARDFEKTKMLST